MTNKYHDAMAIVAKCGKPDLFVTFTCNPKWPELQEALLKTNEASDRPDLIARVFNLKLLAFLEDIKGGNVFGKMKGHMYTVEYQVRAPVSAPIESDCTHALNITPAGHASSPLQTLTALR